MTTDSAVSTAPADSAPQPRRDLHALFCPASIAVVGASRRVGSVGYAVTHNLVYGGYTGVVFPVNPKARSVLGIRCYEDLPAIGETPDLVVIVVPPKFVEATVTQAADMGTRNIVVITAGFKEVGGEGVKAEQRIAEIARQRGLNIIGPNCLGVINTNPEIQMNASFGRDMPKRGKLGLISQSGALCTALLDYAKGRGIGFSRFISFGNKVDVSEIDLLRALAEDEYTRAILMYVEDLSDGQAFVDAANAVTHGDDPKPIFMIKTGRTAEGAAAAASHTGSLAGSDEVYDAILTQAGVFRVEAVSDLFDLAEAFTDPALPQGRQTAIVTNAGGPGIMATDACIRYGLQLARFNEYTKKSLQFSMPPAGNIKNPVDVIGDARSDRYRHALDAVSADEAVHQVVVIVTPQTMTDITEIADVIGETKEFCGKPVIGCLMGMADVAEGVDLLHEKYNVPAFAFPESAMKALAAKCRFAEWTRSPLRDYKTFEVDRDAAATIIDRQLADGRKELIELEALEVLKHYGFPTVGFELAKSADEAAKAASEIGFPVVMKIVGPKILHKTDVGGVVLNLDSEEAVREAHDNMIASVKKHLGEDVEIWGVLVQQMLAKGKEIILGVTRDPRFGPLLMFGLGGIYTEALRDVSFRLAPIRENVATQMIHDIRAIKLLQGVRGEQASDLDAVADCLLRLSQLVTDHPRIKELDINPLLVYPRGKGAKVADARIILAAD